MHFCLNVIYNMSFQLCKNIVLHTVKILLIGTHDESALFDQTYLSQGFRLFYGTSNRKADIGVIFQTSVIFSS